MPVLIPNTTCTVTVQYCYTCCDGKSYYYVYGMNPSGPECNNIDPQVMQDAVVQALFMTSSRYGCSDPCPNGTANNVQVQTPGCWQKNPVTAPWVYGGCETQCVCILEADVTCVDNVITFSNCSSTQSGDCSGCSAKPSIPSSWVTGTCYQLNCPPPPSPCN